MTDLFTHKDDRRTTAIYNVAHHIAAGTINRKVLNAVASALFGGTNAEGRWTQRDSFELLEQGLTRHALTLSRPADTAAIPSLSAILNALPTQTVRSEDQIRYQQFSTPLDLAGLVVLPAQAKPTDNVLEPSAGHGSLVALLPDVKSLRLNELDPKRREALQVLFPAATISDHDAALLSATLEPGYTPSLILMNPPFSRSEGRGGDQFAAVRHLRSPLSRLAPGGRVVPIMPDWFTPNAALGKTYDATLTGCSVVGSYRLDKCYHKQGTSVAVRIYVIDKKPGHARPPSHRRCARWWSWLSRTLKPSSRMTGSSRSRHGWKASSSTPQSDHQTDSWTPFVEAMKAVAGSVEVPVFDDDGSFYNRYAGMLLWLAVHVVFDTVSSEPDEVGEILPANGWLASLVPDDWEEWIAWDDEGYTDALGIVFGHLYNEARGGWAGASEPAPESSDLGMRFLLPGWRQEERGLPSEGSIGKRLAHSDWTLGIDPRRDGPVCWRHHAALLLQDADIDAIMENLMPVLDELADKVTDVVFHGARNEPITIDTWLETWRQTFTHWDDPVRQMVSHFACTGDAAEFIKTFHLVDGLVLLDWLLATHEGWHDRAAMLQALHTATCPSPGAPVSPEAPTCDAAVRPRETRSLEWYVREAYERFWNKIDRKPFRLRIRSNWG